MAILRTDAPASRAQLAARVVAHQQGAHAADAREQRLTQLLPTQQLRNGVLWRTGAKKPFEADPVPAGEEKPPTHARTGSIRVRPSGGLKLTGRNGGSYWDRALMGTRNKPGFKWQHE